MTPDIVADIRRARDRWLADHPELATIDKADLDPYDTFSRQFKAVLAEWLAAEAVRRPDASITDLIIALRAEAVEGLL